MDNTQNKLQNIMKLIRKNVRAIQGMQTCNCLEFEERKGYINNKVVDRLIIFMKGTGCYSVKNNGGCTFCGFYNATNFGVKISDEDYLKQFNQAMELILERKYPIICMYNDGSMLSEDEISFNVLKQIFKLLDDTKFVRRIVIESRVENIDYSKLSELRTVFNREIEIAVGYESASELVRDYCINKSFDNKVFEEAINIAKQLNINVIPLIIFKPPFLNEKEAIQDCFNSLMYLNQFEISRVDIEISTVEKNTLSELLWKRKLYNPPSLWSIVELIRMTDGLLNYRLYISPMNYSVDSLSNPSNCYYCTITLVNLFNKYNDSQDVNIFNNYQCKCNDDFKKLINNLDINFNNKICEIDDVLDDLVKDTFLLKK